VLDGLILPQWGRPGQWFLCNKSQVWFEQRAQQTTAGQHAGHPAVALQSVDRRILRQ
jgi:hypothetical protein